MYAKDGHTDGQTDGRTKATLIAPFPTVGGITIKLKKVTVQYEIHCVQKKKQPLILHTLRKTVINLNENFRQNSY